jgi:plasmid stabilization system protein ParE
MRGVIWTEPALRDLEGIRTYIGQFNPTAAQRIAAQLRAAGDSLTEFADRGPTSRALPRIGGGLPLRAALPAGRRPSGNPVGPSWQAAPSAYPASVIIFIPYHKYSRPLSDPHGTRFDQSPRRFYSLTPVRALLPLPFYFPNTLPHFP